MESITITVVLLVISCILYKLFTSAKATAIPGPKGYPLIGCGFELNLDNIYEKFYEYAKKYGDIYQIKMFQTKNIVLNSQEIVQKAFCGEKYKQYFNHRAWYFFSDHFHAKSHNIGYYQNPYEKAYGEMKKALAKGLHVYGDGTPQFEEHVKSEILRLMDTIDGFQGEEFDVVTLLRESLSNLISILIIGERAEKEDIDGFWKLVWSQEVFGSPASTIILGMFPFLVKVPGYYKNEYDRILIAKENIVEKYFRRMKIFPNVWFIHHDENIWGDPWEFRPERFLDGQGDVVRNTHPYLKSWLPFGVGRRQCPGENLARSRLFLYVGSLMKAFTFLPSERRCGTCDPRIGQFDKNLMLRPKPFYCRVLKRHN